MSDLLYPKGTERHIGQILEFINSLRYEVIPGHRFAFIYASDRDADGKFQPARTHAQIPAEYFLHVRRCLWRYYLFSRILRWKTELKLDKNFAIFLEKMLIMMDTAVEQLIYPCSQMERGQLEVNQTFPLFDIYLTTEFVVGYHDPKSVDMWRKHPDNIAKDLERMDPNQFDWDSYDNALGSLLSGEAAEYDVDKITDEMYEGLVTAIGQWYNIPSRRMTKAQRAAASKAPRLVHGSPGLGELFISYDDPISKGYDSEDEMSVAEWEDDILKEQAKLAQAEDPSNLDKSQKAPTPSGAMPQNPAARSFVTPQTTVNTLSDTTSDVATPATVPSTGSDSQLNPYGSQTPPPNQEALYPAVTSNDPGSQLLDSAKMMNLGSVE